MSFLISIIIKITRIINCPWSGEICCFYLISRSIKIRSKLFEFTNVWKFNIITKSSEIQDRSDFELLGRGAISFAFLLSESKHCAIDLRSKADRHWSLRSLSPPIFRTEKRPAPLRMSMSRFLITVSPNTSCILVTTSLPLIRFNQFGLFFPFFFPEKRYLESGLDCCILAKLSLTERLWSPSSSFLRATRFSPFLCLCPSIWNFNRDFFFFLL